MAKVAAKVATTATAATDAHRRGRGNVTVEATRAMRRPPSTAPKITAAVRYRMKPEALLLVRNTKTTKSAKNARTRRSSTVESTTSESAAQTPDRALARAGSR